MICMGEAGMKRVLFKIIVPVLIFGLWVLTCYPVCNRAEGFDWFLYWILVGCSLCIRRMCLWFVSKNFEFRGRVGAFVLKCIAGGLIGGIVLNFKITDFIGEVISIVLGHFWIKRKRKISING